MGSENRQTTPATTSTTSVRQLLGTTTAQTAPATTSTAPAHQPLGSANAETTSRCSKRSCRCCWAPQEAAQPIPPHQAWRVLGMDIATGVATARAVLKGEKKGS